MERDELEAAALSIEGDEQRDAQCASEDGGGETEDPHDVESAGWEQRDDHRRDGGGEHERRQDREVHQTLTREKNHASSSTAPAAMPSA